ncbi:MAG: LON peptidase substrate-binding domain-containing protein, partial [Alphaproteobacteria bacterium]|nr:LON peptidase substrate-binding domain-containing protein [Alphaproteobacteria bacterium]
MKEFVLPVRELVVHPGQTVPVYVDNPLSVACLETATAETQRVVLCPQHTWNYPTSVKDIFTVGTIGEIAQVLRMPDDSIHTIIKTTDIVNLSNISIKAGLFTAEIEPAMMIDSPDSPQVIALRDRIMNHMQKLSLYHKVKMDKMQNIIQNYPVPAFIDAVVQITNISVDTAVEILKMNSWTGKFAALLEQVLLLTETDRIESDISRHVQNQMEHGQRQAILQEKLRAIQKEIGEDGDENILLDMKKKINESAMP